MNKQTIKLNSKYKKAFTLAEVLITLAVIGVVAAMSIPSLMGSTNKQEYVVALKKETSVLSQAFLLITGENGDDMASIYNGATLDQIGSLWSSKLNVAKNCGNSTGCFANVMYKKLDNVTPWLNINQNPGTWYKLTLTDGSHIAMTTEGNCNLDASLGADVTSPLYNSVCGGIAVDVNGDKGPNVVGRDLFYFFVTKTRVIAEGTYPDKWNADCASNGWACAAKILQEGAMNY